MKKTIDLHIPFGFRLDDEIEHMKVWKAEKYLLSKRIRRYTKAIRHGEDAELHARWLTCPHCASRFAANADSPLFNRSAVSGVFSARLTKAQISNWASLQMSIFDEAQMRELVIVPPIMSLSRFTCPKCENESFKSAATRHVQLSAAGRKIILKSEVSQLDELLSLNWSKISEIRISFPIYEVLTFDLGRGAVYIKMENAEGEILCRRDITEAPELLAGGASCKLLTQNKLVQRNILRLFREMWGRELPVTWRQMDVQKLFQMTVFVGYPRGFYASIPYAQNSFRIDKDFRARARRLHLADNLDALCQNSALPQMKSLRRALFEDPGLFFYLPEAELVWEAIGDVNLMVRFLQQPRVYEVLSELHLRPGILLFLRDFCAVKGAPVLLANIEENWSFLCNRAIEYCCMSERMRLQTRQKWKHNGDQENSDSIYSLPMRRPDETIKDCVIDGFTFMWLRSSNDYAIAAEHLNNCLREWRPHNSPVVGVRRKDRFVAAIEMFEGKIAQARTYDNGDISATPALNGAFQKWIQRYNLTWFTEEDDLHLRLPEDAAIPF